MAMKQFNLEEYLKNPSKKVVTRDGRSVKIHCTNFTRAHNIIAQIEGNDFSASYHRDGIFTHKEESNCDLFFAPEKHEGWLNVWKTEGFSAEFHRYCGFIFSSEEEAKIHGKDSLATIKIEWEE